MSLLLQTEINASYESYYSIVSDAELAEEAAWGEFGVEQFADVCCDDDSFD